jgi:hypothetical protein
MAGRAGVGVTGRGLGPGGWQVEGLRGAGTDGEGARYLGRDGGRYGVGGGPPAGIPLWSWQRRPARATALWQRPRAATSAAQRKRSRSSGTLCSPSCATARHNVWRSSEVAPDSRLHLAVCREAAAQGGGSMSGRPAEPDRRPTTARRAHWCSSCRRSRALRPARVAIAEWLSLSHWPQDEADDLVLAVNEAVTNVIEHAYPAARPGAVGLHASCGPGSAPATRRVTVSIRSWQLER